MADHPLLAGSAEDLRRCHTSLKWRLYPADVLPVWVAEMDAAPCPAVVDAVTGAVRRGDTGYAWPGPYAAAFARFARDEWGWEPDVAALAVVRDVVGGLAELLRLLTEDGGPVLLSTPGYDAFFGAVEAIDRTVVEVPLAGSGRLDLDVLADAFRCATAGGRRAAYVLCNPHNPTGTVPTPRELAGVAALARAHGVRVVSDEIHAPLVHAPATFTPYLTVPGSEDALTVTSASKAWNLAGLKAAIVAPGADAVDDLRRLHVWHTHSATHLGVLAQTAAYDAGRGWLGQLRRELDANRRLLGRLLQEHLPAVRYRLPEATYLAWLDCRPLGLGDDPAAVFLERGRVALSPGPRYGAAGAGHARLNLATSPEVLSQAVLRMANSLA
ncbi:MAG TPA: aminotransferase class I/II-fold pyridoxal phosphate-dependent enzyme [Intrasporangium sp.]|uniref:MalY/PatB family protein n=1 Tax=Intrasporangium sp. TaxID=1925024 RepID=UPI002D77D1CE|nr:aminotransferase class I/II-fold pyridoxal phosphate-dependent enzyme [Intrasporangium sp.]HET7399049.1 aminotransferase class I/II-fold pyridoxal phosphate-dependent enzyme [Intrasporangium sp.]